MQSFHLPKLFVAGALVAASGSAFAQITLNANPGPANNGGSANWAIFFDLTATNDVTVTEMTTANSGGVGVSFTVEVFTFVGSGLGGPVASGPGSSPTGWTSLGTAPGTQGGTASGISLPIDIPDIVVPAGQTVGVAVRFTTVGPRYFGTGTPPYGIYADANLSLKTGDSRSQPFTTGGSFFTSRELVGSLTYVLGGGGPTVYCTAKVNSAGCTPAIAFSGTPSASTGSGFTISASNELDSKFGLLFYGKTGPNSAPFQGGILCAQPPLVRTAIQSSGGSPPCGGAFSLDFNAYIAGGADPALIAGQQVNAQYWSRDPGFAPPDNTNLTDAVEFTIGA